MKFLGSPPPEADFEVATGAVFGLDAAKSWSLNRYTAASTTPRARITTSDEDVAAMAEYKQRRKPRKSECEEERKEEGDEEVKV